MDRPEDQDQYPRWSPKHAQWYLPSPLRSVRKILISHISIVRSHFYRQMSPKGRLLSRQQKLLPAAEWTTPPHQICKLARAHPIPRVHGLYTVPPPPPVIQRRFPTGPMGSTSVHFLLHFSSLLQLSTHPISWSTLPLPHCVGFACICARAPAILAL